MKFFVLMVCLLQTWLHAQETPLEQLMAGNRRFVAGKSEHKDLSKEALEALKEGQSPVAVIIGCADSRVPPEVIFDQGLGRLFVVRVAGNVVGPVEMDSVRFAIEKLKVSLVMVLGHEKCAAIQDALEAYPKGDPLLPHIYPLIVPALKECDLSGGDRLKSAVFCNVKQALQDLKDNTTIPSVTLVGGYYDFDHGTVQLIPF